MDFRVTLPDKKYGGICKMGTLWESLCAHLPKLPRTIVYDVYVFRPRQPSGWAVTDAQCRFSH